MEKTSFDIIIMEIEHRIEKLRDKYGLKFHEWDCDDAEARAGAMEGCVREMEKLKTIVENLKIKEML